MVSRCCFEFWFRSSRAGGTGKAPRYFGFLKLPEVDITALLDARRLGAEMEDVPPGMRAFWVGPKKDEGWLRGCVKEGKERRERREGVVRPVCCAAWYDQPPRQPPFQARLGKVVCDGRVMAVTFDDLGVDSSPPLLVYLTPSPIPKTAQAKCSSSNSQKRSSSSYREKDGNRGGVVGWGGLLRVDEGAFRVG
ncbi:hypothetical protein GALMADRAFT_210539 [Galerina marginata CBS 339.88]|uniref:Uncharacterized protein n=1 Tax=Galerina marginata (strain CBS 339.88) TaxID=685588 RepID=A0A067T2Q4_GALM3|nr:hypothetical protein GALMADRAFT_210539 [Galerina marginata CBS 339.88]